MTNFLSEVQLNKLAPSIFSTGGSEHVSARYGFIPTINVVKGLSEAGFHPVMAMQSRSRIEGRENFVKHVMRFRHENSAEKAGVLPEIVLVNSHDGSTSYQLRAGIYRLVCSNGMIVGDEVFCRRIKHQGEVVDRVVEAANDLIEIAPLSVQKAIEWKEIELPQEAKVYFAESAAMLKWNPEEKEEKEFARISQALLSPKRYEDTKNDLWTTFNIVQENIIRGGVRYRTENGSRQRTRPVNSVGENVRLNTALWTLTEKMAQLVKQ